MDNPIILPVLIGVLAALLGWLIGWSSQRRKAALDLDAALEEQRSSYDILQKEHTHKSQLLAAMQHKHADQEKRQAGFDAELNGWKKQVLDGQTQLENARRAQQLSISEFQAYKSVTNGQLTELSKLNQGLEAHLRGLRDDMHGRDARMAALTQENAALKGTFDASQQRYEQYVAAATAQHTALKTAYEAQSIQLANAKQRISELELLRNQLHETNDEWENIYQQNTNRIADLERFRDQLRETNDEWENIYQQNTNRIADLERFRDQLRETNDEWENIYQQNTNRMADLERLRDQLAEINDEWESIYQQNTNRMADLERLRDQLRETNDEWENTYQHQNQEIAAHYAEIARLTNELADLNSRYDVEIDSALNDLETYKQRIEHLLSVQQSNNALIANLESEIARLRAGGASSTPVAAAPAAAGAEAATLERIRQRAHLLDFNRIGESNGAAPDDLERIKGVGPFTARKLNALGIMLYRQMAALTDEEVNVVNDTIEFTNGRIQRDDWRGQAQQFSGYVPPPPPPVEVAEEVPVSTIKTSGSKSKKKS